MLTHVLSNETVERSIKSDFVECIAHFDSRLCGRQRVRFGDSGTVCNLKTKPRFCATTNNLQVFAGISSFAESAKREYSKAPKEPQQKPRKPTTMSREKKLTAEVSMGDSKVSVETKIADRPFPEEKKQES